MIHSVGLDLLPSNTVYHRLCQWEKRVEPFGGAFHRYGNRFVLDIETIIRLLYSSQKENQCLRLSRNRGTQGRGSQEGS